MDKYRRDDDPNDDLGDCDGEQYEGCTIFERKSPHQQLGVLGREDSPLLNRIKWGKLKLSKQELRVLEYVCEKGYSISKTARVMKVNRKRVQNCWNITRRKFNESKG